MRLYTHNIAYVLSFFSFMVVFVSPGDAALPDLDRGHRVIVQRGLQLQALTYAKLNGYWSWEDWDDSGFTTVQTVSFDIPMWYGMPGDVWWGRWNRDGAPSSFPVSLQPYELPFAPYMVSWQLDDEQPLTPDNITAAAEWIAAVRTDSVYDDVILYTNQPGYVETESNLVYYVQSARPDMLSCSIYPFGWINGSYGPDNLYRAISKYRNVSLVGYDGHAIPFGLYLQTFVNDRDSYGALPVRDYRPSESEIRYNQFAAWAFGCKFVCAFIYDAAVTTLDKTLVFSGPGTAPSRTAHFDYMSRTNEMSRIIGPALVRLLSTDIAIKKGAASGQSSTQYISDWRGNNPHAPYLIGLSDPNRADDNTAGDVLVGYFTPLHEEFDGPDYSDQQYFMIVNGWCGRSTDMLHTAYDTRQLIRMRFDFETSGIDSLQMISRSAGRVETIPLVFESSEDGHSYYHYDLMLEGGTGDVFKFNTGAPFVGTYPTYCGELGYIDGDINKDCCVDYKDYAIIADNWLQ